jgi:hypothetical protein
MRRKITYDPRRDYYDILGIQANASITEIRAAYRQAVREVHPDLNPHRAAWATEQLQRINEAYDVLGETDNRQEYDRLRWPHAPGRPRSTRTYRGPFSGTDYDPSRPWWEQMAAHAPRHYPFAADYRRARGGFPGESSQPGWMHVSTWLRNHRLRVLEPSWVALVGLWRSPYAGLMFVLAVALAINVAVIIYFVLDPPAGGIPSLPDMSEWFSFDGEQTATVPSFRAPDPTQDSLHGCPHPDVQIEYPADYDEVNLPFRVYGTVRHLEMQSYWIEVGYLGDLRNRFDLLDWVTVRLPAPNQHLPDSRVESKALIDDPIDLTGKPAGYYVIRLRVELQKLNEFVLCDVVVHYAPR